MTLSEIDQYGLGHLHEHIIRCEHFDSLCLLLYNFEYIQALAQYYAPDISRIPPFETVMDGIVSAIPASIGENNLRIRNIKSDPAQWARAVRFVYGNADKDARCHICGQATIIHGWIDLGSVEHYDNYYVFCTNCYYAWHDERFQLNGDEDFMKYDYATNHYVW